MKQHANGFSLIEVSLSMVIAAVLLIIVLQTYINVLHTRNRTRDAIQVQEIVNQMFLQLTHQAKWANDITYSSNTLTLTGAQQYVYTYDPTNQTLSLAIDGNPPSKLHDNGINITQFNAIPRNQTNVAGNPTALGYEINIQLQYQSKTNPPIIETYEAKTAISQRNKYPTTP